MSDISVVGGGLAGLVAAIACAEAGAKVTVHEAHRTLGGRARSSEAPHIANDGPHVFYSDGPMWTWLVERGLTGNAAKLGIAELAGARFRWDGRLHRRTPKGVLAALTKRKLTAPVDRDFRGWAAESFGDAVAARLCNALGVVAFDHDPGRLSAAFAWERLLRVTAPRFPSPRYVAGGWQGVVDRLAARARELGVHLEVGSRVTEIPSTPTIVAVELESARVLLGDESLRWESGRTAMLDLGLRRRGGDAFLISDLDEAGFLERYTGPDPALAPAGESLVQAQMPLRPGESKADGLTRLERLYDLGFPGWRERQTWRRDGIAGGRTGALDLPGFAWRDRPAIARGGGVFLAGDKVAAPGLLGEVAFSSALKAAAGALAETGARLAG